MGDVPVYLAGRYDRREELQEVAKLLEATGWFEVTSRWLKEDHEMPANVTTEQEQEITAAFALDDLVDISRADFVIHFTEDRSVGYNRGGRHVELGLGLGMGKKNFIVGPRENVFHYLPNVTQFDTLNQLLRYLGLTLLEGVVNESACSR